METVSDKTITGMLQIDGVSFERCRFESAELLWSASSPVRFTECLFREGSVRVNLVGHAHFALDTLLYLHRSGVIDLRSLIDAPVDPGVS